MEKVERPQMHQAGENNHDVKNLMTAANYVKLLWPPFLRYLCKHQDRTRNFWGSETGYHGSVNISTYQIQDCHHCHPIQAHSFYLDFQAVQHNAMSCENECGQPEPGKHASTVWTKGRVAKFRIERSESTSKC